MKFQKGLLSDIVPEGQPVKPKEAPPTPAIRRNVPAASPQQTSRPSSLKAQDHLFETLREETGSQRNYLKLFGIVVLGVIVVGFAVFYFTLPGVGDTVRAPAGSELALRDHLLTTHKRTATDITFYQCDGYYSANAGVETRNDIPNPLFRIGTYSARVLERDGQWDITAAPVTPPSQFVPCQ